MKDNNRLQQVGIDRLIRLQWLEQTTNLVLAGGDLPSIKHTLTEMLADTFPLSQKERRGSIGKIITVLTKTWILVPKELQELRDSGIALLRELSDPQHLPLHWGMIMAVYPFWGAVASQTGRLLKLQENVTAVQVQRRLSEQYGERTTVSRRVRYVLRAFVDWGVLKETHEKGLYTQGKAISVDGVVLIAWLVYASLLSRTTGSVPLKELLSNTSLFPLHIKPASPGLLNKACPRLEFLRSGLGEDLVSLQEH
jgi:hypothetical protein